MNRKNVKMTILYRIRSLYPKHAPIPWIVGILSVLLFWSMPVYAQSNNIFGIHLATVSNEDLRSASGLVNSNGGSWGYATVVIQQNDRNVQKWQHAFDTMRELKLIPIVRIATQPEGDSWQRPKVEDAREWALFLNSLRWVVRERYIVLFNEPNHAQEWGGAVDPVSYIEVSTAFARRLKESSEDYVVMLAGFDAAAPMEPPRYYDEARFFDEIRDTLPDTFRFIDAWASHSYPNPGFAGSPHSRGRNTIRTYEWELEMLRGLGIDKELPVFITETGWKNDTFAPATISAYTQTAYQYWEADERVVAATPFILNYQSQPFLSFSWQKPNATDFYPHYYAIRNARKISGAPAQIQAGALHSAIPSDLLVDSSYEFRIGVRNDGQAIWSTEDGYHIDIDKPVGTYTMSPLNSLKPGESQNVVFNLRTDLDTPAQTVTPGLYKNDKVILKGSPWHLRIYPLPDISFRVQLFPRIRAKKEREYEIQLFDEDERLVYKKKGIKRLQGEGYISEVKNVYLGGTYRMVLLTRYYLPRQAYVTITKGENEVRFKPLLPLDFNVDGTWNWRDVWEGVKNPLLLGLFLP